MVMPAVYQERIVSRFRAWLQIEQSRHQVALVPPGLLSDDTFSAIADSLRADFQIVHCGEAVSDLKSEADTSHYMVIVPPIQQADCSDWIASLLSSPSQQPLYWLTEYPFWLDVPDSDRRVEVSIDNRFFRYNDSELQLLLEAINLGEEQSQSLTPHDLRVISGAWPGVTDAALRDISEQHILPSEDQAGGRAQYSIAQLELVRQYFARHWAPLLRLRYPWFSDLCVLPLITMDLLTGVFGDCDNGIRECLQMGWLERCPGTVGEYRPDTTLDQLIRGADEFSVSSPRIEAAIDWYQHNGLLAEAIESAAVVGMPMEQLQQMLGSDPMGSMEKTKVSGYLRSGKQAASGAMAALAGAGVAPAAVSAKLAANLTAKASRSSPKIATSTSRSPENPIVPDPQQNSETSHAVSHILHAINLHQGYNWTGVSEAISAAIDSGFERQQVSRLVDFVDLHMRPLLQQDSAPLTRAIRSLNHSAPAKASLARPIEKLNHRELQILQRMAEGLKNSEISEQLGLEISTVKWYGTRIYEKLGVSNRTQAAIKARKLKMVE